MSISPRPKHCIKALSHPHATSIFALEIPRCKVAYNLRHPFKLLFFSNPASQSANNWPSSLLAAASAMTPPCASAVAAGFSIATRRSATSRRFESIRLTLPNKTPRLDCGESNTCENSCNSIRSKQSVAMFAAELAAPSCCRSRCAISIPGAPAQRLLTYARRVIVSS